MVLTDQAGWLFQSDSFQSKTFDDNNYLSFRQKTGCIELIEAKFILTTLHRKSNEIKIDEGS